MNFRSLSFTYLFYNVAPVLSWGFATLLALTVLKLSVFETVLVHGAAYLSAVLTLFFVNNVDSRKSFFLAGIFQSACFLLLAFASSLFSIIASFSFAGVTFILFWCVYNYLYFEERKGRGNASSSAFYYAVPGLLGILLPVAAIFIIGIGGFSLAFLASSFIAFVFALYSLFLPTKNFKISLFDSINSGNGFRSLVLLEGLMQTVPTVLFAIIGVAFFPTPPEFGFYLSFLGVTALAAMAFTARLSDQENKRKKFLVPAIATCVLSIFLAFLANTGVDWLVATSIFSFAYTFSSPLRLAVVLDRNKTPLDSMVSREFFLNVGRLVGVIFALVILLANFGLKQAILFFAAFFALYVCFLYVKKTL